MGVEAPTVSSTETWGPVCRGFGVSFPDGERGWVEEIRARDGGVELLVATGSPAGRLVTIDSSAVEAILPGARQVIVERSSRTRREDVTGVEAAGGIVRMPTRHSSRLGSPHEEAA
jgi:hypothetical protein